MQNRDGGSATAGPPFVVDRYLGAGATARRDERRADMQSMDYRAQAMAGMRLHHVQLAAPRGCETAARRFFGELLGLEEVEKPDALRPRGGVWFDLGAGQLHVGVVEDFSPALKAHPGLEVSSQELDVLAARLEEHDASVRWDTTVSSVRRFYTDDPWGNRIELFARC